MRFRLLSAHYLPGDKLLNGDKENEHLGDEKGTVVGDGTPYPDIVPTLEMAALDEEAEEALEKERQRVAKNGSMQPVDQLPMSVADDYEARYVPGFPGMRRPTVGG